MGKIFKVLLLVLTMVFFAPPQGANALKCLVCKAVNDKSIICPNDDSSLSMDCGKHDDICISKASVKDGTVTDRLCGKKSDMKIQMDKCMEVSGLKICICDKQDCDPYNNPIQDTQEPPTAVTTTSTNSGSIYLNGWPVFQLLIFSLKIIIDYGLTQ